MSSASSLAAEYSSCTATHLDPLTIPRAPLLREIERVFRPFSVERRLVAQCHSLLKSYEPEPTDYVWWQLARMAKTLQLLSVSLPPSGSWLDISSDAWFWLLAKRMFPTWAISPTGWEEEQIAFRSRVRGDEVTYAPLVARIAENTQRLTQPGERFDVVTAFEVIEHLQFHPGRLFCLANAALTDGGLFVISTPNGGSWSTISGLLNGGNGMQTYRFGGHMTHRAEYSTYETKRLLQSSGFRVERIVTSNVYPSDCMGWSNNILWAASLAVSCMSCQLVRVRNLLLRSGSTQFVFARKVRSCDESQIVRV